jgi:hypothetical protein
MAVLALRILLAPCFVIGASLIGRRFGVRVGGVVAGLPVIAGPILLVLALQQGAPFARSAAVGTLLGMVALAAFVLAYVGAAERVAWSGALTAGWAAFVLVVVAVRPVSVGPVVAFAIACGALLMTLVLLPRPPDTAVKPPPHPRWDLPLRAACTAIPVVVVTAAASALGPHLSGLITAFPIITPVLAAFTHAQRGREEATRLLRGFTIGFFAYAGFCLVVATAVRPLGIAGCFALATAVALVAQAAAVGISHARDVVETA